MRLYKANAAETIQPAWPVPRVFWLFSLWNVVHCVIMLISLCMEVELLCADVAAVAIQQLFILLENECLVIAKRWWLQPSANCIRIQNAIVAIYTLKWVGKLHLIIIESSYSIPHGFSYQFIHSKSVWIIKNIRNTQTSTQIKTIKYLYTNRYVVTNKFLSFNWSFCVLQFIFLGIFNKLVKYL